MIIVMTEFKVGAKAVGSTNEMDWEFQQRLVPGLKNRPKLDPAQMREPNPD
jgi:hypothetical protein